MPNVDALMFDEGTAFWATAMPEGLVTRYLSDNGSRLWRQLSQTSATYSRPCGILFPRAILRLVSINREIADAATDAFVYNGQVNPKATQWPCSERLPFQSEPHVITHMISTNWCSWIVYPKSRQGLKESSVSLCSNYVHDEDRAYLPTISVFSGKSVRPVPHLTETENTRKTPGKTTA